MSTSNATENLYLLEFLINDVNIDGAGKCDCGGSNELCVSFQFLDNQELQVCERDFEQEKKLKKESRRIGKSCIFSLWPQQLDDALRVFDLNVYVQKKLPPEQAAKDAIVGGTIISASTLLGELVEDDPSSPSAKVLEDKFPLTKNGRQVGTIDVFLRLSCYGKTIITQFQMNMKDKTVLFKDREGRSLYRYRRRKVGKTTNIEDASCPNTPCFPGGNPPCTPGGGGGYQTPPAMYSEDCPCSGPPPPPPCPFPPPCQFPPPPPPCQFPPPPCALPGGNNGGFPMGGGGWPPPGGMPGSGNNGNAMFFSPTLMQQAAAFPSVTFDKQMGGGPPGGCQGGCGL